MRCVTTYIRIKEEQFDIQRIDEQLEAVQNLVKIFDHPIPIGLEEMVQKLYSQMREIEKHSKRRCQISLYLESEYRLPIQYWYNKIHAYENLITLKECTKKCMHKSRVIKFSKKHEIENHHRLSVEECKDGL